MAFDVTLLNLATFARFLFFVITLFFTIFTLMITYHWFTYGTSRKSATLTLAVYLLAAAPCLLVMSLSLYVL